MSILEHDVVREEICKVTKTYDETVIVMSILEHNVVRERERERERVFSSLSIFDTRAIIRVGLFRLCPERVGTARAPRVPASIFGPLYKQTFITYL